MSQINYLQRQNPTGDVYYDSIHTQVHDDLKWLFEKKLVGESGASFSEQLGEKTAEQIQAAIVNCVISPLISGLASQFASIQTLKSTTLPVLERDRLLHTMPDIFHLHTMIIGMSVNSDIYGTTLAQATNKYKDEAGNYIDGWNANLLDLERSVSEREKANGVTYRDEEVPYRDEPIEVIDILGKHRKRVRYTNFSFLDQTKNEQVVTDMPAFWDDEVGEYIIISLVALWKSRKADDALILQDTVITGDQISQGLDPLADLRTIDQTPVGKAVMGITNQQTVPVTTDSEIDTPEPESSPATPTESVASSESTSSSDSSSE